MLGFIIILFIVAIITGTLGGFGLAEAYKKDNNHVNTTLKTLGWATMVGSMVILLWVVYNSAKSGNLFSNYVAQLVGIFGLSLGLFSLIAAEETPESDTVQMGLRVLSWSTVAISAATFLIACVGFYAYGRDKQNTKVLKIFHDKISQN